jgi:hypothetical protein
MRFLASLDADLQRIIEQWNRLPATMRTAVVALMELNG